jgi:hypothetical protein
MTLLNDEEWSKWSDREIARCCAVSNDFVSRMHRSLSLDDSDERACVRQIRQRRHHGHRQHRLGAGRRAGELLIEMRSAARAILVDAAKAELSHSPLLNYQSSMTSASARPNRRAGRSWPSSMTAGHATLLVESLALCYGDRREDDKNHEGEFHPCRFLICRSTSATISATRAISVG